MKSYELEHELMRRKIWSDAWSATANAIDCKSPDTATKYANAALKAFDSMFPKIEEKNFLRTT